MREFCALLGLRQKFSGPLRPCEMGKTERLHQESQKVLGLLVHDVCKARPHEWSELLGVVEFILDTTPGPSGVAPRDFERGWSLASPLYRERTDWKGMLGIRTNRRINKKTFPKLQRSQGQSTGVASRELGSAG